LSQILPREIDTTYRGHRLALWLFGIVLAVKTGIALGTIVNGRTVAQTADGIPLDSFGAPAAAAVLALFAIWGLSQLAFCVIGALTLVRYRAMIPFMFGLLLLEHVVRRAMLLARPIAGTVMSPGLTINLALLVVMAVGLALSLRSRAESPSAR
jgi:hypothetical protein